MVHYSVEMVKQKPISIDALFGSKTRVKLLHLFLNNPGKAFFVREITRLVDEQINSVRRELANMMAVGVVHSESSENKLYYQVNEDYEFYTPFRAIFSDEQIVSKSQAIKHDSEGKEWQQLILDTSGIRAAVAAGILVQGSASPVDLLLVSNLSKQKLTGLVQKIEGIEQRELNYSVLSYDEFYYRLSVRDKFIMEMLSSKHIVVRDDDNILTVDKQKGV